MGLFDKLRKKENKNTSNFPFRESENLATFICSHVLEEGADITFAVHGEDSTWQFTCNGNHDSEDTVRLIALSEAYDLDPSIGEIANIPYCRCCSREKKGAKWVIQE